MDPKEHTMTHRGQMRKGMVVMDDPGAIPDGTMVSVRPLKGGARPEKKRRSVSLYERLKPFIGIADDLPADISINHDHYLYGTPKRK
jgi:hypothetical protein